MVRIDYANYTLEELLQAKSSINSQKYPDNYASLLDEISKRQAEIDAKEADRAIKEHQLKLESAETEKALIRKKLKKSRNLVVSLGWIQLIAAAIFLYIAVGVAGSGVTLSLIFLIIFMLINLVCGVTLLFKKRKWYWLSAVNQALQIPNFLIGKFLFNYASIGGLYIGLRSPGGVEFNAILSPGFQFHYILDNPQFGYVFIDIVALIFLSAILYVLKFFDMEVEQ